MLQVTGSRLYNVVKKKKQCYTILTCQNFAITRNNKCVRVFKGIQKTHRHAFAH